MAYRRVFKIQGDRLVSGAQALLFRCVFLLLYFELGHRTLHFLAQAAVHREYFVEIFLRNAEYFVRHSGSTRDEIERFYCAEIFRVEHADLQHVILHG